MHVMTSTLSHQSSLSGALLKALPKTLLTVLGLLAWTSAAFAAEVDQTNLPTLRIVNWSYYIEIDESTDENLPTVERSPLLQEFMAKYNCNVDYIELDNEDEIVSYVLNNIEKVDMTIDATEHLATKQGTVMWLPVNEKLVPNLADIRPEVRHMMGPEQAHFRVPVLCGTTGILYRRDKVPKPQSWNDLYANPHSICLDSSTSVFVSELRRSGVWIKDVTLDDLKSAARNLRDWLGSGRVISVTADLDAVEAALVSGEATMTPMWSGDAMRMMSSNPDVDLDYTIPKEGGEIYYEAWMINPNSQHINLACAFANFMLAPENQVRLCVSTRYQVVSTPALKMLKEKFPALGNSNAQEPLPETLKNCDDSTNLESFDLQQLWERACLGAKKNLQEN